jgi:hypothetical protein
MKNCVLGHSGYNVNRRGIANPDGLASHNDFDGLQICFIYLLPDINLVFHGIS